jgi:hypothetical protein
MTMTYRFGQPRMFVACLTAVLLATFSGARPGWAQETPASGVGSADLATSATEEADSHASSQRGEAIKVHGHWTIDVRNPDGTLGRHHEFENSLLGGDFVLAELLARNFSMQGWVILLDSPTPPCTLDGNPTQCIIWEANAAYSNAFQTLTLNVTNDRKLRLMGDFTAFYDGTISNVWTRAFVNDLSSGMQYVETFSRRFLDPVSIPVAAGQHVYVTVTFSFS